MFNATDVRPSDSVAVFGLGGGPPVRAALTVDVAEIRERTGCGVDYAVVTTGVVAALNQAYEATWPGGMTVTVGLPDPSAGVILPALRLKAEEKTLRGSYLGSCVPRFIVLYQAGLSPVEALPTHSITLEEINAGFARLRDGGAVRQVVTF